MFLIPVVLLGTVVAACGARSSVPTGDMVTLPTAGSAQASVAIATVEPMRVDVATMSPMTTTAPPTRTGPTTFTAADNGAVVVLHPGESVTLVLDPQGAFSWHVPEVKGTSVKQVSASGGYPGQQPARATFTAVQPGSATLTAYDDTPCLHAKPLACQPPQHGWEVTVIVY